jgi:NADP-dependent 3-hydroxy acid dehydrogenase YdfG
VNPRPTVNTVKSTWKLTLQVQSSDLLNTKALADALTTDEVALWNTEGDAFSFSLNEAKAKDLRAMWNTRVRGLIAVDSLLHLMSDTKQSEDSSTPSN